MLSSPVDDIKSRLDIVEVVSSYIKLSKTGANYRAVCPFHAEKTPSFFVSPARQMWHCFGCGIGGSIFDFVMKIEGVEFGDALRTLAQRAGVELKPFRPEMKELNTERTRLYEIGELACQFFEKQLGSSKAGLEAKNYLLGRGISEESIKSWRLGYAPDVWQGLIDFLAGRGYKRAEIEKAGLVVRKEDGGHYDRFRGRIMFPVSDLNSQVVGFGGRVFAKKDEKEIAKYINTPATILYDKSRTLYGLDRAKVEIRRQDSCILVEGYTDAILAHQAGSTSAVAVSGTALTPWHLKILKRYTQNLFISFDMDVAGDTATKRGIDMALGQGFNIKIILLPEGKDPAELIIKSPSAWEKAVQEAKSILEFYFDTTLSKFDKSRVEGKKEISRILLSVIKKIPNKIEQTFWVQRLAKEISAKEQDLSEEMAKIKLEEEVLGLEPEEVIELPPVSRKDLLEERLLVLLLRKKNDWDRVSPADTEFFSPGTRQIISVFQKFPDGQAAPGELEGMAEKLNYLALKAETLLDLSEKEQDLDVQDCLRELRTIELRTRLETISQNMRLAETEGQLDKAASLFEEFQELAKKLSEQ